MVKTVFIGAVPEDYMNVSVSQCCIVVETRHIFHAHASLSRQWAWL